MNKFISDEDSKRAAIEYKELHDKLYILIADGKLDSKEADELRDAMDDPWYRLNEDDKKSINII